MANLESAITERGTPEAKELEAPSERYYFRTSPAALDVLDAARASTSSTMANNHGADYGPVGLADTLARDPDQPGPGGRHRPGPAGRLRAVPRHRPGHRPRVPGRRRLHPRGLQQRLGGRPEQPRHRRRPRRPTPRAARRGPGSRAGAPTSWSSTCTGAPRTRRCPTRQAADHSRRPRRGRRRRRRRHACPRAARLGLAGRHLRRLRPGQLPLVPRPPARVRCPPGPTSATARSSVTRRVPARIRRPAVARPLGGRARPHACADWSRLARLHRPRGPQPRQLTVAGSAAAGREVLVVLRRDQSPPHSQPIRGERPHHDVPGPMTPRGTLAPARPVEVREPLPRRRGTTETPCT